MTDYMYEISACSNNSEAIYKTNDFVEALRFVRDRWNDDYCSLNLVNKHTNEVLFHYTDGEEPYMSPETRSLWENPLRWYMIG